MRTRVDQRLIEDCERYAFRFTCESCCYFAEGNEGCALGYPNQEHREGHVQPGGELVFCKEFELT
ncbi:MAG: hypothetical protein KC766_39095 [Myxococcales bacterium]|nr:hypothetical protein [Myxococcales bacterium]